MTTFKVEHLKTATEAEVKEISTLCLNAFRGDISIKALIGGDWSLHPDYSTAVTRATVLEGELYVVKVGNEIVSTASWFGPGTYIFKTPEQRALGYDKVFERLSPEAKYWNTHTYPEVIGKLDARIFTDEERSRLWWLYNLATKPGHEGRGYATALMDTFYDEVKRDGMFVGVAPAREINVKKYAAMGFRSRGETLLPSPTGDFVVNAMTRETDRKKS